MSDEVVRLRLCYYLHFPRERPVPHHEGPQGQHPGAKEAEDRREDKAKAKPLLAVLWEARAQRIV